MLIECPYCATTYELDPVRLAGTSPRLKCSRCQRIFPAPAAKRQGHKAAGPPRPQPPDEEANPELPFGPRRGKEPAQDISPEEPVPGVGGGDGKGFSLSLPETEASYTLGIDNPGDDLVIAADEEEPDKTAVPERPARRARAGGAGGRNPRRRSDADRESGMVWAILVILAVILTAYAALARALLISPAWCDEVLGHLPFISGHTNERLLVRKVALSDLVVGQERIKYGRDGKPVLVVTGRAVNGASVGLHSIQIAGRVLDRNGRLLREKTVYCGHTISTKVLQDLTPEEVAVMQSLTPPKQFSIVPGEAANFAIVFMDPPKEAAELVTQVTAAHPEG